MSYMKVALLMRRRSDGGDKKPSPKNFLKRFGLKNVDQKMRFL